MAKLGNTLNTAANAVTNVAKQNQRPTSLAGLMKEQIFYPERYDAVRAASYSQASNIVSNINYDYADEEEKKKYRNAIQQMNIDTDYFHRRGYIDTPSALQTHQYLKAAESGVDNIRFNTYDEWGQGTANDAYIGDLQSQLSDLQNQLSTVQNNRSNMRSLGDVYMQQNAESNILSQIDKTKGKLAGVQLTQPNPDFEYYNNRTTDQLVKDKETIENAIKQTSKYEADEGVAGTLTARGKYLYEQSRAKQQNYLDIVDKILADREREERSGEYLSMLDAEDFDGGYDPTVDKNDVFYQAVNGGFGDNALGERIYYVEQNFDEMTDAEKQLFNYIHKTQGKEAAEDFFDFLQRDLNLRDRIKNEAALRELAKDSPIGASMMSSFYKIASPMSAVRQIIDAFSEDGIDQNAPYNFASYAGTALRNQVSSDIQREHGVTAAWLYNAGMSVADNLLQMGLSGGNQNLILGLMSSSVFADSVVQMKDEGKSDAEILTTSTVRAAIEFATEKIGLDNVFKFAEQGGLRNLIAAVLAEGGEEGLSDIGNLVYDTLESVFRGRETELKKEVERYQALGFSSSEAIGRVVGDQMKELGLDVLSGALSGFMLSGGAYVGQNGIALKKVIDTNIDEVVDVGLSLDSDSDAYKFAQAIDKTKTGISAQLQKIQQMKLNDTESAKEFSDTVEEYREIFRNTNAEDIIDVYQEAHDKAPNEIKQWGITQALQDTVQEVVRNHVEETNATVDSADSNNVVQILRFKDATARTESGEIVKVEDINFKNEDEKIVFENATKGLRKTADANDYIAQYRAISEGKVVPAASYDTLFKTAYDMGRRDATLEEVLSNEKVANVVKAISDVDFVPTLQIAIADGMNAAFRVTEGEQTKITKMGKAFGYEVKFVDGLKDSSGRNVQGKFEKSTKTIYISTTTSNPATMVFCHELTHAMEQDHKEAYEVYKNRVLSQLKRSETSYENRRDEIANLYGWDRNTEDEAEKTRIEKEIDSELVAIASENFLIDESFVNNLKENKSIFRQLRNTVINKYKLGAGDYFRTSLMNYTMADANFFEKLGKLWIDSMTGAEITESNVDLIKEEAGIETDADLDTDFTENQYSIAAPYKGNALKEWLETLSPEARETYDLFATVKAIGKRFAGRNWTTKYMLASEWNDKVANDKNFAKVAKDIADAIPKKIRESWLEDDGTIKEAPREKSLKMQRSIMQRLVDRLPMTVIEPFVEIDGEKIRVADTNKIYGIGGEAYRQALYNARLELYKEGRLPVRKLKGLRKDTWGTLGFIATNTKTGASGDFTTYCPQMYYNGGCFYCYRRAALESGVNNKLVGENVWYTGELLQISKEDITDLNKMGGLRIQSFGDWMDRFSPQLAQLLSDADRVGLQVKIITKEPSMISAVARIRDAGIGKSLYFNLSADYTIERAGSIAEEKEGGVSALNPMRPYMRDENGDMWWKRALTPEEANEYREKYPWVNTRIVATTVEEFIRGLKSPIVDVVTGYHGHIREYERIDSETGETIVQMEALGDAGMPRFRFDYKTQTWEKEYEGKTKTHKLLGDRIEAEGLQYEYFIKSCCITGRCASCVTKCGLRARSFNIMNATNRDAESVAYWKEEMINPTESFSREFGEDIEFDNTGVDLTDEQISYFKDSKARDAIGNLLVFYHGTESGGFTIFDSGYSRDGISFFFTDNPTVAKSYSGTNKTYTPKKITIEQINDALKEVDSERQLFKVGDSYELRWVDADNRLEETFDSFDEAEQYIRKEWADALGNISGEQQGNEPANYMVYLNLKNPLIIDAEGKYWDELDKIYFDDDTDSDENDSENDDTRRYVKYARDNGYDGVIFKNIIDTALYASNLEKFQTSTVAVAFDSNQIKSVDNTNPTEDPDMRYSREFENPEETDALTDDVAKALKGIDVSNVNLADAQIEKIAERILRGLHSRYPKADLVRNLKGAFGYWVENENVDYVALKQVMADVMVPVVEQIYTVDSIRSTAIAGKTFIISEDTAKALGGIKTLQRSVFPFGASFTTNQNFTNPNRQVIHLTDDWNRVDEQGGIQGIAYDVKGDSTITDEKDMVQAILNFADTTRADAQHRVVPETFVPTYANNLALRAFIEFIEEAKVNMTDVRERARANVRRESAKLLEELRQQYEQQYLDMMAEGEEAIQQKKDQLRERDKKAHYFDMLKREMKRLERLVKRPTRNKHIDIDYVKYLGLIGSLVDITSNRRFSKANNALRELAEEYQRLARQDVYLNDEHDLTIYNHILKTADIIDGRAIRDLSSSEIKQVFDCVRAFIHAATQHNNFIDLDEARDVNEAAIRTIADVRSAKGIGEGRFEGAYDWWATTSLNPLREIDRIVDYHDDDPLHLLMNKLVKGEINVNQYKMEMAQIFSAMDRRQFERGTREYERAKEFRKRFDKLNEDFVEVTLGGATQLITEGQKLALIMHNRGKDNMTHILEGGVLLPNLTYYKRGDLKNAYKRGQIVIPTEEEIADLGRELDDFEKWFLDRSIYYFESYAKDLINKTSFKLEGFARAEVENYYPIRVAENYTQARSYDISTGMETSGDNLHSGMLMARVRSTLPIYLNSITQDLQRSQSFVARYAGLAIPLRDFNRMYFIKIDDGSANGKPLRDVINEKWGDNATKYIDKMLKDLTQGRDADTNSILDRIRSKSAQAVLTLNPSVSIKQAASYPTAIAELDYKSVMRALVNPEGNSFLLKRADMELIQKYTPLLWSRMAGMSTQEIAELSMMQNKNAIDKGIEKLPILTDWIRKVDVATVGRLWYAAQYWVDDHYKNVEKGSDQYYKLVADKFEDVVTKTQPNYSVLTRPDILRTNNSLVKALMMFKTQPLQNFGLLFDSASRLNSKHRQYLGARGTALEASALAEYRDAGAKFARTVTSQLLQTAVFTGMTFLANALVLHRWDKYKDDELNEVTFASVMEQVMWDYADSLFGSAFMIDWAEDLGAYFIRRFALNEDVQYYGISVFGIDNINDLSDLVTKMSGAIKDGDSNKALKYAKNFAESIAQLVGIPASNVEKIIKSVWEYSLDFSQGRKITDLSGNTAGNYWHRIKNAYSNGENVDGLFDEMTDAVYDNMVSKESVRHFITENDDSGIMEWVSDMYVNGSAEEHRMVDDWLEQIYTSSTSIKNKKRQFFEFQDEEIPVEYMTKDEKVEAGIDVEAEAAAAKEEKKKSKYDEWSSATDQAFNDFLNGRPVSLPYKKGDDGVSDQLARLYQTSGNPEAVKAFAVQELGYSASSINWTANRYWTKDLSAFD